MRYAIITTVLAGAFAIAGCAGDMDLPENFVHVGKDKLDDYHVRGISADGVVVGLRSEDNAKKGTIEFWTQAIEDELKTGRGYKLTASEEIESRGGLAGRLMTFSTHLRGAEFKYLLAIYLKGDKVLIAEAGGKADVLDKHAPALREALLSVR
ncbi:MAG: hypothetical protein ACYTF6_02510 [Planctomycetota bacterium]|jgi:hypothetical protein